MNIKNFINQCRRVLLVASKPDKDVFKMSLKITALGMIVIGLIGFAVFMIFQLIGGF
ncbi:MAG: protein translocase SEC61 complex subunit gamma [Candidatus Aenigmatarchaeota archaeon]|nr:MAG: protein translocase SEC61 complex subunit gamma [Candidatus Aenigmarchaeota archaeon]